MNQMGDLKEIIMFKVYEKWQQNGNKMPELIFL